MSRSIEQLNSAPRFLDGTTSVEFANRTPLHEFKARLIGPDVTIVTYRSETRYADGLVVANRMSVWCRGGVEGWRLEFHW